MDFQQFAAEHGVIIRGYPEVGKWVRCATVDKPRAKNGAYKFMGDVGFVQNWATMPEAAIWRPHKHEVQKIDLAEIRRRADTAERERIEGQKKAAAKAAWIMGQCHQETHPYLAAKGFPDLMFNVWQNGELNLLCVPMRQGQNLVGAQMITPDGDKRFLYGQKTTGATFEFNNKGKVILCEGLATALSIRECLAAMRMRYHLVVCFSAGNMLKVAQQRRCDAVVADNDVSGTGQRVADQIGLPYYLPQQTGDDFNDEWQRNGTARSGLVLKSLLAKSGFFA